MPAYQSRECARGRESIPSIVRQHPDAGTSPDDARDCGKGGWPRSGRFAGCDSALLAVEEHRSCGRAALTLVLTTRGFRRTLLSCLALAIGAGILAGACGGDGGSAPSAPPPTTPAPSPAPAPPPPPTCTVGLVLRAGDSCTYPGTSQTLTVNADGSATFGFVTSGASINISSNNITLIATRQNDGSWLVQQVGAESANRAPVAVGTIPGQTLTEGGGARTVDVSANFRDPDGDALTYAASSSRPGIVRVTVSGSRLTLTPEGAGSATVTVTATDPAGLSATQRFGVSVSAPPTGGTTSFGVGERIPTFPEGFDAIPNVSRGGVSLSVQAGRVTIGMQRGAYLEYDDYRYTCNASRCEIENGVVTEGEIVRTLPGEGGESTTGNRAPRAADRIPDQVLTEGGRARTVDVSEHFEDPDGDDLTYRATSNRSSVVRVTVSGSDLTLTPRGAGTATVTVTAADPAGLSASQSLAVTVTRRGGASGSVLRDDFDDSDSLDDWEFLDARESISGGVLRLTRVVPERTARALRSLDSAITDWKVAVRMGRERTGSHTAGVVLRTGDPRRSAILFELTELRGSNYELSVYDEDEPGWLTLDSSQSSAINNGPGEFTEFEIQLRNGILRLVAEGATLYEDSVSGAFPTAIESVELWAGHHRLGTGGTALFDWIAVDGEHGGGATGNRSPRAVGRIPDQTLSAGGSPRSLDVSRHFDDPDGDDLTYRASSSRTSVVRVSVSGSEITLSPRDDGTATVTVTATDPDGRSATQRFDVTVGAGGGTSGEAAEAELTSCPASSSGGELRFTLRGTVTANRRLTDVRVHGCAGRSRGDSCEDDPFNFDYIGTDNLGTIEQGSSREFEISGSPTIPVIAVLD